MFPSPCGEKVGINFLAKTSLMELYVVSVPLRGKGRDQLHIRGTNQVCVLGFPSPCGEKVGINLLRPKLRP